MYTETATMDKPLDAGARPTSHAALVRRVNQLYHELTGHAFDAEHRYRHRVERSFWQVVARRILADPTVSTSRVVVDLACGTGFVSGIWRPYLQDKDRLIAVDLGLTTLKATRSKWMNHDGKPARTSLFPVAGDGASLPLADKSVDLLGMNAALHHVPDPIAVLREIDRVLRPGGYFALGFEPNRTHFGSRMFHLARGMERIVWYSDLRQNRRRLHTWLSGGYSGTSAIHENSWVVALNDRLIDEGHISVPLSEESLLDLVDPHARGAGTSAGFEPTDLLRQAMPTYEVCRLTCCDYLGLGIRRLPAVRTILDTLLHAAWPNHGSLFSWLVRKGSFEDSMYDKEGERC